MTISEHSFNEKLLPKCAFVLDLGCRGFEFSDYFRGKGHIVYAIDVDKLDRDDYYQFGISDKYGNCDIEHSSDPAGTRIKQGATIEMHTIKSFSDFVEVSEWDLIKMDIEGSEYKILETAKHPLATQVSVEFHEHTSRGIGKQALDKLLDHLEQWYTIHNRVWEERHGAGFNYWDILLIAK